MQIKHRTKRRVGFQELALIITLWFQGALPQQDLHTAFFGSIPKLASDRWVGIGWRYLESSPLTSIH